MRAEQTVNEMAEEALSRQARALAKRTGEPLVEALEAVLETPAGSQLEELSLQGGLQLGGGPVRRGGSRPPRGLECRRAEIREEREGQLGQEG